MKIELDGVTEYCEEMPVEIAETAGLYIPGIAPDERPGHGRLVLRARNEGGHNATEVDLLELIAWLKNNRPDLLDQ